MRRPELLQGIREMKFGKANERYDDGELSQLEAAELLGVSERTFPRRPYRRPGRRAAPCA